MNKLMTKNELATLLGVSCRTVDRLREEGLPCLCIGRQVRFVEKDVMEWLNARHT